MMRTEKALPPIVAFSRHPWGGLYNSIEPRVRGIAARGWKVLYSNGANDIWNRDGERWKDAPWLGGINTRDGVLLDRPGRWPFRWRRSRWWDRQAVASHARRLRRAVGQSPDQLVIAYLFHPDFYPYVAALEPAHVIFRAIDNYAFQPGWTAQDQAWLGALVERADLLLVNNRSQGALLPGSGPERCVVLGNAVDIARMESGRSEPAPLDLLEIPAPRIGYVGMLNAKIDFEMIAAVAAARPDWHWVLIGPSRWPVDGEFPEVVEAWRRCEQLPNIHFLGERPADAVATYLAAMDVNTLCYRLGAGPWVMASYPLKVLECLAAGKPVVSSAIPEVMRHRDVIDFPRTTTEWVEAIDRALTRGGVSTRESRLAVARANTWDERMGQFDCLLRKSLGLVAHPSESHGISE